MAKKNDLDTSIGSISRPAPEETLFKGRPGDPRLGEIVRTEQELRKLAPGEIGFVIFGNPDDLGVRLNRGRAGAKGGPDSIRRHLYKMSLPMDLDWPDDVRLIDAGNIQISSEITETHRHTRTLAQAISRAGYISIALGGGHDFAAPTFAGYVAGQKQTSVGLINVDPHLDVRELENGLPHSGTPFRQLIDEKVMSGKNFVEFGARANRNSRSHFNFCVKSGVQIQTFDQIRSAKISAVDQYQAALLSLTKRLDLVGATFDMDSCSESEGMSAAPVVGFGAWELVQMATCAGRSSKVKHFEIAEVAPELDPHERSSRIAAEMIYAFVTARIREIPAIRKKTARKPTSKSKGKSKA